MGVYSIDYFSQQYKEMHSASLERALTEVETRRLNYNFRAMGFNIATISAISLLACSIFSSSLFLFGLSAACYFLREAFSTSLDRSIVANYLSPAATEYKMFLLSTAEAIETHAGFAARMARKTLSIGGDWQAVKFQIFSLRLWMNLASLEEPVVAVQFQAEPAGRLPVNGQIAEVREDILRNAEVREDIRRNLDEIQPLLDQMRRIQIQGRELIQGVRDQVQNNPPVGGQQIEGG
jgi:uncharacterized membrane protein